MGAKYPHLCNPLNTCVTLKKPEKMKKSPFFDGGLLQIQDDSPSAKRLIDLRLW
jgi:hypothetical protein